MGKRVDYCIVGVHFAKDRTCLETVRILPDTGDLLVTGLIMPRQQIIARSAARHDVHHGADRSNPVLTYTLGPAVGLVKVDGVEYLRLDETALAADDLGMLPEY